MTYLLLIIGFAAACFSGGGHNVWLLAFVWQVAYLILIRKNSSKKTSLSILVLLFAAELIKYHGLTDTNILFDALACIVLGVCAYIPFEADKRLFFGMIGNGKNNIRKVLSVFIYPSALMLSEMFLELIGCPYGFVAYTQSDNIALAQSASVWGTYGLTFAVAAWCSAVSYYFVLRGDGAETKSTGKKKHRIRRNTLNRKQQRRFVFNTLGISTAIILCIALAGQVRLWKPQPQHGTISVASASGPYLSHLDMTDNAVVDYVDGHYQANVDCFENAVGTAAGSGADLLIFNEEAFGLDAFEEESFKELVQSAAKENKLQMIVPVEIDGGTETVFFENKIWTVDENGNVDDTYYKSKLHVFSEALGYTRGDGVIPTFTVRETDNMVDVAVSGLIGTDASYVSYVNGVAEKTDLLTVSARDADNLKNCSADALVIRAIENGVNVVKSDAMGSLFSCDAYGNAVTSAEPDRETAVTISEIPNCGADTFYGNHGRAVNIALAACAAVILIYGISVRKQPGVRTRQISWYFDRYQD